MTTDPSSPDPRTRGARHRLVALRCFAALLLATLAGCGTYEDKRINELYNRSGFGTRASGDATRENYLGGFDTVQFLLPPEMVQPPLERLAQLSVPQPVSLDGTIFVPLIGPVFALGKTEAELAALVRTKLRSVLNQDFDLQARIRGRKFFYAIGEVQLKGPIDMVPDMTLIDAVFRSRWTNLANLGRVHLIKPDAQNPLVIDVNVREMLTTGYVGPNFPIRERDIVYIPPTFLGMVARLFERLLQPVSLAVRTMLGAAQATFAYDVLSGESNRLFFRF